MLCLLFASVGHGGSKLQADFDCVGPTMQTVKASSGRSVG
jgi:hypothetical protein